MTSATCRVALLSLFVGTLAACASMAATGGSFFAPGAPPIAPRSYAWAPAEPAATGDPRLDANRFLEERVHDAVDAELAARGFVKSATPTVLVQYHANVVQDIYLTGTEQPGGQRRRPEVFEKGTLVIDLVDAATGQLVWRGWAVDSVDGVVDDQAWMERRIDEAVARIVRRLPAVP